MFYTARSKCTAQTIYAADVKLVAHVTDRIMEYEHLGYVYIRVALLSSNVTINNTE